MNLSGLQLDALTEIFNHGVGKAAHGLSQLAKDEVTLSVPRVDIINRSLVRQQMKNTDESHICSVRQSFTGALNTEALLMFPVAQSLQLVQLVVDNHVPLEQLAEMEQEALAEVANIVLNSVVASFADMLHVEFECGLPQVEIGLIDHILYSENGSDDVVLSVQIEFHIVTRQISGYLAFLLDMASGDALEQHLKQFLETV